MVESSNRLPILAAEIKQAQQDIEKATTVASDKAIFTGHALIEAKALVAHGEWLPFLQAAGVHERTAQRLMTLAESRLQSDFVSYLGGPTAALRFLSLRQRALKAFDEAEASALAGVGAVEPIEAAMDLIERMVAMFPPRSAEGGAL